MGLLGGEVFEKTKDQVGRGRRQSVRKGGVEMLIGDR